MRNLVVLALCLAACGRLRYDLLQPVTGAGGSSGTGAAGGSGGASGAGGSGAGGAAGAGGTVDAGGAGGAGGTVDAGGAGGATDAGGADAGGAGGSSDAGGIDGNSISCAAQNNGTHDYLFCDALVDWASARSVCESRGMRLARIDDSTENDWILANALFSGMFRREYLWIGGYEPTTDGDWHWTDGDAFWSGGVGGMPVGGLYTNWDTGREPNNAVGPEACVAYPLNKTIWFDIDCSYPAYFVCEMY